MANTISDSLIVDTLIETVETVAANRISGFGDFVIDFSSDAVPVQNGKPITAHMNIATATGETQQDPTNFQSMGTTLADRSIAMHLFSQPFGMTWSSGFKLEAALKASVNKLMDKLVSVFSSVITTGNFGALNNFDIAGAGTTDKKDNLFQDILALATKGNKKVFWGNSVLYAKGAPVNQMSFDPDVMLRVRGFDGFYENTYFNTNAAGIKGMVSDGNGIAMISRVPVWDESLAAAGLMSENITLDKLGLTIQFNKWADTETRSVYGSLDVIFGAGVFDTSATHLIGQTPAPESQE